MGIVSVVIVAVLLVIFLLSLLVSFALHARVVPAFICGLLAFLVVWFTAVYFGRVSDAAPVETPPVEVTTPAVEESVVSDTSWVYVGEKLSDDDLKAELLPVRKAYRAVVEGDESRGFVTLRTVAFTALGSEFETHYFKQERGSGVVVLPVEVVINPRPAEYLEPLLSDLSGIDDITDADDAVLVDGNLPDVLVALLNLSETETNEVA